MTETGCVIQSKLPELRRRKEFKENRDLPLRVIAEETGLAVMTVQRIMKGEIARVYISTLETLCKYFDVQNISELIEYIPDAEPDAKEETRQ